MASNSSKDEQLQIRLVTTEEEFSVASTTLSVPAVIDSGGLNKLLQRLLIEDGKVEEDDAEIPSFDFVLLDEFLRGTVKELLSSRDVHTASGENVFEVSYLLKNPPPQPEKDVNHDDWVAGVSGDMSGYVLTACYDHTVNIFEIASGEKLLTIPNHEGPVRAVAWVDSREDNCYTFVSASHDQTLQLYEWNAKTNSVDRVNVLKGHERSVDCVAVSSDKSRIASGSFDTHLKIWSGKLAQGDSGVDVDGDEAKRAKTNQERLTRTPLMTLAGHKEGVSSVAWTDSNEVATASWDHTIKIWDVEEGGMKTELVGNKSFFGLSYSKGNGTLLTCSADRAIRLYDPRSTEGAIVKAQFISHNGWVTSLAWSRTSDTHFVSAGHDGLVKLWDTRSHRAPLYDLKGHEDRLLACDWSHPDYIVSGGTDNSMKIFKANVRQSGEKLNDSKAME